MRMHIWKVGKIASSTEDKDYSIDEDDNQLNVTWNEAQKSSGMQKEIALSLTYDYWMLRDLP